MLRPAVTADLEAVCALYRSTCEAMAQSGLDLWHWGDYPNEAIITRDIANGWCFLWEEEGAILGAVCVNESQPADHAGILWLYPGKPGHFQRVAVAPSAQGRGIARKMLTAAEDVLRARGCAVIHGDVFSLNERALHLYDRLGMRRAGTFPVNWSALPGHAIALEKQL